MDKPVVSVYEQDLLSLGYSVDGWVFNESVLQQLAYLKPRFSPGIYRLEYQAVRFGNTVGLIELPEVIIEILPKVSRSLDVLHTRHLWTQLLQQFTFLPQLGNLQPQLLMQPGKLTQTIQQVFLHHVSLLMQRGLSLEYREQKKNQDFLRGKLLLADQIRHNLILKHRFYVQVQDREVDHPLNQRIKQALTIVAKSGLCSATAENLLRQFRNVSDLPLQDEISPLRIQRKNQHYRTPLRLADLICRGYLGGTFAGQDFGFTLLFDMSRIFEQLVQQQLYQISQKSKISVEFQPVRKFWQDKNLRPDFLIHTQSGQKIIIDTKWKVLHSPDPADEDLRQVFAYTRIFAAQRGILLYPQVHNLPPVIKRFAESRAESTAEIQFIDIADDMPLQLRSLLGLAP